MTDSKKKVEKAKELMQELESLELTKEEMEMISGGTANTANYCGEKLSKLTGKKPASDGIYSDGGPVPVK